MCFDQELCFPICLFDFIFGKQGCADGKKIKMNFFFLNVECSVAKLK